MHSYLFTLSKAGNAPNAASRASGQRNSDAALIKTFKAMRFVLQRRDGLEPYRKPTDAPVDGAK